MKVALLSGGRSSEHEVSLASAASVRAGLLAAGHDVLDVELARDGAWHRPGERDPLPVVPGHGLLGADVAWPVLHGPFGEDGTVQGLLELLDVPYVGSGVAASAVAMDKVLFKDLMARAGVPQVDYRAVRARAWADPARREALLAGLAPLGLPLFVKPARLGSSVGIVKVTVPDALADAIEHALGHDPLVIVEAFSDGMEVECSVLGWADPEASVPGEIVVHADWYDYEAKYAAGGMELVVPARIDAEAAERVRALAVEAFVQIDCAGLARVDCFVEAGGRVLLNELNTLPGFTATSVYPKLWEASGVTFGELCDRLLEAALDRHRAARAVAW